VRVGPFCVTAVDSALGALGSDGVAREKGAGVTVLVMRWRAFGGVATVVLRRDGVGESELVTTECITE
jgi:hypothetical protein